MINLGIVGGRDFKNRELFEETVSKYLKRTKVMVSGGASGADTMGAEWADINNLDKIIHLPDYETYGRYKAPFVRNQLIVDDSDFIIAFWNKESKGTKDTIDKAHKAGKPVLIVYY